MDKRRLWKFGLAFMMIWALALAGCGGGGGGDAVVGNADTDGDLIPNTADALALNPARFLNMAPAVALTGLPVGATFSTALAVNNAAPAQAVGQSDDAAGALTALRWSVAAPTAPVTLAPLTGGTFSAAYAINTAGVSVGEADNAPAAASVAVFWPAGAAPAATALNATGLAAPSAAHSINTAGQIVGEATVAGANRGVLWNSSATTTPVVLPPPGTGDFSAAYFINDAGIVVGEANSTPGGPNMACAWLVSAAGAITHAAVGLGTLPLHATSIAFGVDATGKVVGEAADAVGGVHAAMWTINLTTLAVVGAVVDLGVDGSAAAINGVSRIVGDIGTPTTPQAKVWDVRNIAHPDGKFIPGLGASQTFGINNANVVVGISLSQAFVASPLP